MKPFLAALILLALLTGWQPAARHAFKGGIEFVDDAAYLDQAVAQHLAGHHLYGAGTDEHPIPALRSSLWRVMLAFGGAINVPLAATAVGLAALFILGAFFAGVKLSAAVHASSAGASALLMAGAAGWPADVVSGTSQALAALLVTAAVALYVRSYFTQEEPVPLSAALCMGLACALHLEFIAFWIAFWLHALAVAVIRRGEKEFVVLAVRGFNGLLLIALVISPIIAWNMKTLGVPWPRLPDTSLGLDKMDAASVGMLSSAIPLAFSKLHALSCLQSPLFKIMFWLGLAACVTDAVRDRALLRNLAPAFLYLLVPVIYGALTPLLGWSAAPVVFKSLNAVWIVTSVRGLFLLCHGMLRGIEKIKAGGIPLITPARSALAMVVILAAFALIAQVRTAQHYADALRHVSDARRSLEEARDAGSLAGTVAVTDQPGWLLRQGWFKLVDLTGETTVRVLALVRADGSLDEAGLIDLLRREKVDLLVLWSAKHERIKDSLSSQTVKMSDGAPYVGRVASIASP